MVDGDTIDLNDTRWRLWGIDAPETHQTCGDGWPAGVEATATMRKRIEGKAVTCELRGHDRYKRSIGLCRADGEDLGPDEAWRSRARLHEDLGLAGGEALTRY